MSLEKEYNEIYAQYLSSVVPLIESYEVLSNTFPIGILNEIRAVFTHMAKAAALTGVEQKESQIKKARGHMTRALRDCYKYNCMAMEDQYKDFMSVCDSNVTLKEKVFCMRETALDALFAARKMESSFDSDSKIEEIHCKYREAYNKYSEMYEMIKSYSTTSS